MENTQNETGKREGRHVARMETKVANENKYTRIHTKQVNAS